MSSRKRNAVVVLLGLLMLTGGYLGAQTPNFLVVHYDEVDPTAANAYEANSVEWVEAFTAAGLGAEHSWDAYLSGFTYAWVSGMPNWAYMDSRGTRMDAVNEAIGEEKVAALEAGAAGAILSHHTEVWSFQEDLSHLAGDMDFESMGAVNVGIHHVKPGKGEEFEGVVKDVIAALAKIDSDSHFYGYQIPFGNGSYGFVSFAKDRAALHSGPPMGAQLAQAVGPEGAQALWDRWTATITGTEERDWQVRRDLSYSPAAASAEMEEMGEDKAE